MALLREEDARTARRKGITAAAVAGGAVLLIVSSHWIIGGVALLPAWYLTKDWFSFRARRGMRL